jgi:hypothetical protein
LNFPHFAIFVGKNGKKSTKSRKNINTKKIAKILWSQIWRKKGTSNE